MNHTAHYMLIAFSVFLNIKDRKAILLSLAILANVTIPFTDLATSQGQFYFICGAAELTIAALALWLNITASRYVVTMCVCLTGFHLLGFCLDGYPPNSPYRILVKIAEFAEIISCIVFSKPILELLIKCRQN